MNFDYCLQTQKKKNKNNKNHSTVIHNVYFLVLDYLEPWLNFMIVSMFVLESRQAGDVQNPEPQTQWLSVNARLDTLSLNFPVYKVKIFQNVTQNLLSQNFVNLLHLSSLMNVKIKLDLKTFKRKNLVLVFWNFLVLCTNLKSCMYTPESQNRIWSTPTLMQVAKFFWPSTDGHSPVESFFCLIIHSKTTTQRHSAFGIANR